MTAKQETVCIPLLGSRTLDVKLTSQHFKDATAIRICISRNGLLEAVTNLGVPIWADVGVDGFHTMPMSKIDDYKAKKEKYSADVEAYGRGELTEVPKETRTNDWAEFFLRRPQSLILGNESIWKTPSPSKAKVVSAVSSLLDECNVKGVHWISVPQLPLVEGGSRNKMNQILAKAAHSWSEKRKAKKTFVLPVIFTSKKQIESLSTRRDKVMQVQRCAQLAGAKMVWLVHTGIDDESGSDANLAHFTNMLSVHELVRKELPGVKQLAGPYWLFNVVMWARGIVDYPVIGLGGSYNYVIPGSLPTQGIPRVCLRPLARRDVYDPSLREWLSAAAETVPKSNKAHDVFEALLTDWSHLETGYREQTTAVYRRWINQIEKLEPEGRALALYHMLSNAHALGSQLPDLPATDRKSQSARRPGQVAIQLMLKCLS